MPCRRGRSFGCSNRNRDFDIDEDVEIPFDFFGPGVAFRFGRRGRGFGSFPPHHFRHHHPHFHHGHHHFEDFVDVPPPPPPPHFGHHPHPPFHHRRHFRRGAPYGDEGDEGLYSRSCMRTHVSPNEVNVIVHQRGVSEENTQVTFEEGRIVVQGWTGTECRQFYHSSLLPQDIVPDSAEVVIIDDRVHMCVHRSQQQDQQQPPNAPPVEEDLVNVQPEPNAPEQPLEQQGENNALEMSGVLEGNDVLQEEENVQDLDGYVDVLEEDKLID
eukprot:TRINITY_DN3184_c0_g1_i6.p1 TRINITY_DN3184_c0_g1~~TRINITY_DN3184_c0_g1_i6.p1  ORF type:complete len:270 (-),score=47.30 TRINITY_DN3184_c0_g1_i6:282-1091(-)